MQFHNDMVGKLALIGRIFAPPNQKWDDAEIRAYLDRPAPSPPLTFFRIVVMTAMAVAAVKVAWILLSHIY